MYIALAIIVPYGEEYFRHRSIINIRFHRPTYYSTDDDQVFFPFGTSQDASTAGHTFFLYDGDSKGN